MTKQRKIQLIPHIEDLYCIYRKKQICIGSGLCDLGMLAVIRANHISFHFMANKRGAQAIYEVVEGKVARYWHNAEWIGRTDHD